MEESDTETEILVEKFGNNIEVEQQWGMFCWRLWGWLILFCEVKSMQQFWCEYCNIKFGCLAGQEKLLTETVDDRVVKSILFNAIGFLWLKYYC